MLPARRDHALPHPQCLPCTATLCFYPCEAGSLTRSLSHTVAQSRNVNVSILPYQGFLAQHIELARSLTHSPTHSPTHSHLLTRSLAHSLTSDLIFSHPSAEVIQERTLLAFSMVSAVVNVFDTTTTDTHCRAHSTWHMGAHDKNWWDGSAHEHKRWTFRRRSTTEFTHVNFCFHRPSHNLSVERKHGVGAVSP